MMALLYRLKEWLVLLFRYPMVRENDSEYDAYWAIRKLTRDRINEFQKERADLVLRYLEHGSTVMDIGCGNGALLARINRTAKLARMIGVDISADALVFAGQNGLETVHVNFNDPHDRETLPHADYLLLFEVIEHTSNSEELVRWAQNRAQKGIFISVPNTGFISHRLRLLLGRFPLQWRVHPSEHVRFWTLRDMKWWLRQLGIPLYKLHAYQGLPLLRKWWPSLFAEGLFIYIPTGRNF